MAGTEKWCGFFTRYLRMVKYIFFGKNQRTSFPDDYFVLSFGVLCVVFAILLYRHTLKQRVYRSLFALAVFNPLQYNSLLCQEHDGAGRGTACKGGILTMHVNAVPYDAIFKPAGWW